MPEIKPIIITARLPEMAALLREHWAETEHDFAPNGPEPDAAAYAALEQNDAIIAFGAFDGGVMVGYVVLFIGRHPHYAFTFAQHDVLFVTMDYRLTAVASELMRKACDAAKARGAAKVAWHAKPGSTFARLIERRGCELEDAIYTEKL